MSQSMHFEVTWADGINVNKDAVRAGFKTSVAYSTTLIGLRTLFTSVGLTKLQFANVSGVPYYLDAADTTTADDGETCIVSASGDRYKRVDLNKSALNGGYLEFAEVSAPGTPASGKVRVYAKTDGNVYQKDDTGLETGFVGGGSGGGINDNLLINGDFQINQRVFAGGSLSAGVYGFDRWKAATGGASVSRSGFVVTLASGAIEQVIETALWGYASLASTVVTVSIDAPSADITVTFGSQSGTITTGAGRRSLTLTLGAGDTGNLTLKLAVASSTTFGRVKLEVASTATAWVARDAQKELMLCMRYYETTYEGVVAGTVSSAGQLTIGAFSTSTAITVYFQFGAKKRVSPTMTIYSPDTGTSARYRDLSAGADKTVSSLSGLGTTGLAALVATTGNTTGNLCAWHFTASAEL